MAYVVKRGKVWRGSYRDPNGKVRHAGSSRLKKEALALAQEEEAKLRHGTWFDPAAGKVTFAEYFETQWLPHRVAEANTLASRSHYNSSLREAFGKAELRKITPAMIQRWVSAQQKA
jgi:hypothetical protein